MSNLTAPSIEAKLKFIVAEQLGLNEDEVRRESSLVEDLGADSLDLVEITMSVEEELDLELLDEEIEKLKTFGEVVDFIAKKRAD